MESRPPNKQILHSFMLWYQDKHNRAASVAQMAGYCPLWKSRQGAYHAVKGLAKDGLVEQRQANEPGQRKHKKWWALDLGEKCEQCGGWTEVSNIYQCKACWYKGFANGGPDE